MTADAFTEAVMHAAEEHTGWTDEQIAFVDGAKWARAHLAAQEPTDAAQIIDHHRQDARSVGYGVTVYCACGAALWGYIDGSHPIDDENNSHREADRKHAAHVADMLARAARDVRRQG